MQRVWLTECYIRVDRDGDGVAELLKVTLAGQDTEYASGSTLLDIEEVDSQPFVTWSPVIRTHTFYGNSVADLVLDLQEIKTTLMRSMLDNTYLSNNGRTGVNDQVNVDDALTHRPGGLLRTYGSEPPSNHIYPIPQTPLPEQAFLMLDVVDDMRKNRTGVGEEVGALEGNELAKMNTGVAAMAYDAARSKVELMVRICAELGVVPLLLRIHELMRKHSNKELSMRLNNDWVPVRPQAWRTRTDMTVSVGIGQVSRERRVIALADVIEKQAMAMQGGLVGTLLTPEHMHKALTDYYKEMGLPEGIYWMDPAQAPPRPPEPDYQAAQLQIAQGQTEAMMQRNQVEALKIESNERIRVAELEQKQQELVLKAQIEGLKADLVGLKAERDSAGAQTKALFDAEIKQREFDLQAAETRLRDQQEDAKREVDMYKALMQSSTTLTVEQMKLMGITPNPQPEAVSKDAGGNAAAEQFATLFEAIQDLRADMAKKRGPQALTYDDNGLLASIGDIPIKRGADGRPVSIG